MGRVSSEPFPAAPEPTRENTAAVVVLFQPDGDLSARLQPVLRQVARLFAISNDDGDAARLDGLESTRLDYIANGRNLGLAAALNVGLVRAQMLGFAWCLLLDQDTVVHDDLIAGLANTYRAHGRPARIGLLVPNYRSPCGARLAYPADVPCQVVVTAVTSGSLVPLSIIGRVGTMYEPFFIEGIDTEFCLRTRAAGLQLVASGPPLMTHGAGATDERRFFGRTVLVGHHSPWRCYLQFRNVMWILRRYARTERDWAVTTVWALVKRIVLVCLYERQRPAKLWAIARGTCAGLWGTLS